MSSGIFVFSTPFCGLPGLPRLFPLVAKGPARGWRGGCASLSTGGGPVAHSRGPVAHSRSERRSGGARPTTFGDIGDRGVVWRALSLDRFFPQPDAACRRCLRCVEIFL